jgi:predicted SnoaL-like aldol condensation-catalyzing enzyme
MNVTSETTNKALVLVAFDTLFNKRDFRAAEQYWSPDLVQHSSHIGPGREGLFDFVTTAPRGLKFEAGMIVADADLVVVYGRLSGTGRVRNWIVTTVVRIDGGQLVEQWDVMEDEASQAETLSGRPMFGERFPETP